jgi:EAL domain-containing protein (putative c-di-GMP-specific phosphodiesterase class I)/ABC-type amino acid transport substrate-binding protein/GGDEF domain-containing protein
MNYKNEKKRWGWVCGCAVLFVASVACAKSTVPETIIFAGDDNYPPLQWVDESGKNRGMIFELEKSLVERQGRQSEHRLMDWAAAIDQLESGEVDVVAMFASKKRSEKFLFTTPFYFLTHGIYGLRGSPGVSDVASLSGKRVALEKKGYAEEALSENHIAVIPVLREDFEAALRAVINGEAEFAVVPQQLANRAIALKKMNLQPLGPPIWPRPYVFAVSAERPGLHEWLQNELGLVISSGRYYDIFERWRSQIEWSEKAGWWRYKWLLLGLAGVLLLALLGYGYSWQMRNLVQRRTRDLEEALDSQKKAESELRHWASHDRLTGLATRAGFFSQLQTISRDKVQQKKSCVLLVLKLTDLNEIICALGFQIGEGMLAAVGQRFQKQNFLAVGHFGRGVFAVLAEGTVSSIEDLIDVSPLSVGGMDMEPRFGVGVARLEGIQCDVTEVLRQAETAMAVGASRRRYWMHYHPGMDPDPQALFVIRDFRRMQGEGLSVCLQPQVDLSSGTVVGAEVLVRWNHPSLGELSPAYFVPLLERAGLISRLTEYVLHEAVRIAAGLRHDGLPTCLSVNVSAVDLLGTDLYRVVLQALEKYQGRPEDLRLEMTETSVISDPEKVSEVVARLAELGVECSIDDFGVGFSSMSYLRQFAVSEIKIDRSFVSDMLEEDAHYAIVRAVIALAHELNMTVVAEGPEDNDTVKALMDLGCDRIQGYVFSRPVPLSAFYDIRTRTLAVGDRLEA